MTLNLPRDDFPRRLASASRRAFSMNLDSVVPDSSAALFAWGFRGMLCPLDQVIGQIDSGSHLPKHSLPDDPALPKQNGPSRLLVTGRLNLILAATYVPTQLPVQYHRLSGA